MKSIEQVVTFRATPVQVFEALMDSARHAAFTGEPAQISHEVGGAVSCYDGKVTAINLDIVPNQRIVQAWRSANFPPGVFTIATFALAPDPEGTKLTFTQHAVPESAFDHLTTGWQERYWKPLRAYLEGDRTS
jgi:activator of HSP90 ATPase